MFCPNCGHQVAARAAFCGNCGYHLTIAETSQVSRRRGLLSLTIFFVIVIAILFGGLFLFQPDFLQTFTNIGADTTVSVTQIPTTSTEIGAANNNPLLLQTETTAPLLASSATKTATPLPSPTVAVATATATATAAQTPIPTLTPTSTLSPTPTTTPHPGPERLEIGRSVQARPVEAVRIGTGPNSVIFVGGLQAGFAPSTVRIAQTSADYFSQHMDLIPPEVTLYFIISAAPDNPLDPGSLSGRLNANGVDLNRNWGCEWRRDALWRNNPVPGSGGTAPFSEPETASLAAFIEEVAPVAVIFWQALFRDRSGKGLVSAGACGLRTQVSAPLATAYGQGAAYNIGDFERRTGQIVNGDATNWLDSEGIPAASVLLTHYERVDDWEAHLQGILAVLQLSAEQ